MVKLSSLGDVLHALPTIHALREAGVAAIDWVVQTEYACLARMCPLVDRVIGFPRHPRLAELRAFFRDLRRSRYDLVADLQGLLKSALVARCARSSIRVGPSFHREGSRWLYSEVAGPRNRDRHAVEECLDVVRWLGWPIPETRQFPLNAPPFPRPDTGHPRIALCPSSRWPTKNWPVEHFVHVGRELLRSSAAGLYLLGSASDVAVLGDIERGIGDAERVHNLGGRTTLVELVAWMRGMDLAITVDTGPMHLAAALGVPVLALFGPTDPMRTGPYGTIHRVLRVSSLPCMPCFSKRCARGDHACMRTLLPSLVVSTALEMLNRRLHAGDGGDRS